MLTDDFRLPALNFYLSRGVRPVYNSLVSFFRWPRIMSKIGERIPE